jgi:hypothetical protein
MELDRDVPRAGDLEDARRDVAVERDLAVGVVVRDDDPASQVHRRSEVAGATAAVGLLG